MELALDYDRMDIAVISTAIAAASVVVTVILTILQLRDIDNA